MNRLPKKDNLSVDPLALQVWEDVVYSMDQYTHDSVLSKFFLPEQIVMHCRLVAAAFAQLHYTPIPDASEIRRSRLFALFLLAMTCGVQTYLKERAIFTNASPYQIQMNPQKIRDAKQRIFRQIEDGVEIFSPFDQVMGLFLNQLTPAKRRVHQHTQDRVFNDELFDKFLPISLIWGYLFAKEMVLSVSTG